MANKINTGIVLLAAGNSSRLKQNKLMLKVNEATLLENAIGAAVYSGTGSVMLVAGHQPEEILQVSARYPVETVLNDKWHKGIGNSVKCGVKNLLKKHPGISALIISVCDQPYLSSKIFNGLINTFENTDSKIVASAYQEALGVPVLYDKSYFDELLQIPDADGAKKHIIQNVPAHLLATFPFPEGNIDIDTFDDLKKLNKK